MWVVLDRANMSIQIRDENVRYKKSEINIYLRGVDGNQMAVNEIDFLVVGLSSGLRSNSG
jgi:hypothetical protein